MTVEERYRERYKSGDTPWDIGQPDFNLIEVVTNKPILNCKVLDDKCHDIVDRFCATTSRKNDGGKAPTALFVLSGE